MNSAKAIQVIDNATYKLCVRGCEMTLKKEREGWAMYTVNAAVRAWRNGYAIPKVFGSLEEVEAQYKTWRGVALLVGTIGAAAQ